MNIVSIVIQLFVVLFAITIHEASHGWAANRMGDPTALNLGRVTLNPIAHIDPIGTILLPILLSLPACRPSAGPSPSRSIPTICGIPARDNIWISFAGPASNLAVAAGAFLLLFILKLSIPGVDHFIKLMVEGFFRSWDSRCPVLPKGFYPLEGLALLLLMMSSSTPTWPCSISSPSLRSTAAAS